MFSFPIEEGIELRIIEERYAHALFALTDANRQMLRQWLPWVDQTHSVSDIVKFIRTSLNQYANNDGFQCGVWFRGELAGAVGYHLFDWKNRRTSIGYWLGERFQGAGLMTKAVRILTDYALIELKLNRVEIRCADGNDRSRAIPERLGFVHEGMIRETEWLNGRFLDHHVYGMLREEWETCRNG